MTVPFKTIITGTTVAVFAGFLPLQAVAQSQTVDGADSELTFGGFGTLQLEALPFDDAQEFDSLPRSSVSTLRTAPRAAATVQVEQTEPLMIQDTWAIGVFR